MPRRSLPLLALAALPAALAAQSPHPPSADPPEWWRGEVCYELFVRSFQDSDGDGIGDLRGLTRRLDYINDGDPSTDDDLGAGCIWLMPVSPAPSYHGYDITNHYFIDREYGTEADFHAFVDAAHARGIRVIHDLVLNHTSSEHPWFRSAAMDSASPYRGWYIWRDEPREMPGWQAPTWHPNPFDDQYYFGLFWHEMPDLDLGNPEVAAETKRIARHWLEVMDVDGLRLDAVAHFFERDGQWRHAPGNHPFLREFGAYVRGLDPSAFTVGEVFDEDLDGILPYYPDQLDSYFMFEAANAVIEAARDGTAAHLIEVYERMEREIPGGRYSTLLRNHDQTRTMTELAGDRDRAALAAALLLTLPGNPFIYYGEEIGMTGSKDRGDPRLRTPMHWARGPAAGFTDGMPWEPLRPDSLTANVEAQADDPGSLLNHYRRLVHLRNGHPALATGDFLALETGDDAVLAFLRRADGETALVVANLAERSRPGPVIAGPARALGPGDYTLVPVLGGDPVTSRLRVGAAGGIRDWRPIGELDALETRVLLLDGPG